MANGYEVRIGEQTKSADGKRLMPFVMIFREEQAQESIHDLKPCMSDSSISRQAVIDAIDEIESEVADGDGFQYDKWRQYFCDLPSAEPESCEYWDAESNYCALNRPSAQPEPEEFEWCHDCKEYDQEAHCCHRWTKVIRNTVEEIKNAQAERKWIPVTERLPEDGERVLLQIAEVCLYGDSYVEDYYYVSGSRSKGRWFVNVHPDISVERGGIIAWMPLPEPWKGEEG